MSKQLTEEEQLVWDRLLKGIPAPPKYSYIEELLAETLAKEIANEIDRDILNDLMKMSNDK